MKSRSIQVGGAGRTAARISLEAAGRIIGISPETARKLWLWGKLRGSQEGRRATILLEEASVREYAWRLWDGMQRTRKIEVDSESESTSAALAA